MQRNAVLRTPRNDESDVRSDHCTRTQIGKPKSRSRYRQCCRWLKVSHYGLLMKSSATLLRSRKLLVVKHFGLKTAGTLKN